MEARRLWPTPRTLLLTALILPPWASSAHASSWRQYAQGSQPDSHGHRIEYKKQVDMDSIVTNSRGVDVYIRTVYEKPYRAHDGAAEITVEMFRMRMICATRKQIVLGQWDYLSTDLIASYDFSADPAPIPEWNRTTAVLPDSDDELLLGAVCPKG